MRLFAVALLAACMLTGAEHHGQVMFNGLPIPGATVTAGRDGVTQSAVTDARGFYSFSDLADGTWRIEARMFGFAPAARQIEISPAAPAAIWELKLLRLSEISANMQRPAQQSMPKDSETRAATAPEEDDLKERAADGFLINGSMNNSAASPFAQAAAFGNNRFGGRSLYNGGIGLTFDNSALDARPFSLTGQDTPKPAYNRMTGMLTFGGPLQIPRLFSNGPFIFAGYQWTRNNNATNASALVPDLAARNGILPNPVIDPLTGQPFAAGTIPQSRISPQARALLSLYPLPNFSGSTRYNYQVPLLSPTHQDALQTRANKILSSKDQVYGGFAFQSTRTDDVNLFGFLDTTGTLGMNANVNWSHRFSNRVFLNLGYQFSRLASRVTPFFENRANVSGNAGIAENNQEPMNWGPPGLVFASGIANLSDAQSSFNRSQTGGVSASMLWNRRAHNMTFGGDFRRQQFNYLSQENARGTFTFTGAASGSDFGDFLLGIPAASSIAFGNADKYLRGSAYDAYFADDWRISPALTLNAGVRWEYGAPLTELYGRLVNLDLAPGFTAAVPVIASDPVGRLSGERYPGSLVRPDKHGLQPRVGIAWRPLAGSSLIVRAGYGVYYDTSVYQTITLQMAQQPPLSKALSVENGATNPLTLANGFTAASTAARNTFAIDPNFRVGYAQNWQVSVQRDLPGALQMTATYLGIKGTRGLQEFLPNTFPIGAEDGCGGCPAGFAYLTSNGNSTRQAAQLQLRRRLHSGFAAMLQYTFSKSIDNDAALGGQGAAIGSPGTAPQDSVNGNPVLARQAANLAIAQNWLDLRAERGLSNFDQRHVVTLQAQYTTGMGLGGGTLLNGWKGTLAKDWTIATQITGGSGLPQTPIYMAAVPGTAVTGTIRANYTGAPVTTAPAGLFLNPTAFSAPAAGQWGNAGRNSITGPAQFSLGASLARTFRLSDRWNLDLRVDAANALNHVSYTAWNTTINSAQFALPAAANAMRSVQTTLRLRF